MFSGWVTVCAPCEGRGSGDLRLARCLRLPSFTCGCFISDSWSALTSDVTDEVGLCCSWGISLRPDDAFVEEGSDPAEVLAGSDLSSRCVDAEVAVVGSGAVVLAEVPRAMKR